MWEGCRIAHPEGEALSVTYTSRDGEEASVPYAEHACTAGLHCWATRLCVRYVTALFEGALEARHTAHRMYMKFLSHM